VVRVGAGFAVEFPGGDSSCTEAYATLVRTGEALLAEIDRRIRVTFGLPHAALTALAVIEGAGEPVTPSQVSDRMLAASATMTATLDLLGGRVDPPHRIRPTGGACCWRRRTGGRRRTGCCRISDS
jgi:hypothetical protein